MEASKVENPESNNFILDYLELNEGTEIPDMFALWCGITGVSMALGRSVWIQHGRFQVFLNLYTILVAASGQKKSTAIIDVLKPIIQTLEPPPNILSQGLTPQALVKALKTTQVDETGKVIRERCEGWAIPDELSTFINKTMYDAGLGPLLTSFYDCKEYSYETIGRGKDRLENIYLGILGGSTADWIASAIPVSAIGGGVTSRIIFVYSPKRSPAVGWPELSPNQRVVTERLIRTIRRISQLKGEITITSEAKQFFISEYERFYNTSPFNHDKTLAGYANRRGSHMLKVSGLLAIGQRQELVVGVKDIEMAKRVLENAEQYMPLVLGLISSSAVGLMLAKVYELVKSSTVKDSEGIITQGVAQSALLGHFSHQMIGRELKEILDTLVQSRRVECKSNGKDVIYYAV